MTRAAIASIALMAMGITVAVLEPLNEVWKLVGLAALIAGLGLFGALLFKRVVREGKGDDIVAEIVSRSPGDGGHT